MLPACGAALGVMVAASAASAADAAAGKTLVETWCTSCHVTPAAAKGGDTAPPFAEIAERRALEPDELRRLLADPHPPMPKLHLSRQQVDDVAAYIRSLHRNR